uniref:CEA cell adhesion molecule 1 n=1 Tax=Ursus maritimus TaxID=29073 RepID=A0A452T2V9_URSMA
MEPPSAPPRGGHVPWQELLLAVSLLTFWNPPTTAQVTVESVPPDAAEGKDVLLRVHNLPGDLLGCNWFRGETVNTSHQIISYVVDTQVTTPGPAHSGRETIYPNGSLLFQRVTLNGTGYYTLQIVRKNAQVEQGTGQIRVFPELPKPNITSNNSDPVENADSVVLTCEPQTQSTSYLWSVNSKSLPASARLELSLDNRTLTIHRVTRNDTGPYQCETRNPVSADGSDPFTLNVLCDSTQPSSGLPPGAIAGIVIGVLAGVAVIAALVYFLFTRKSGGASDLRDVTEHKPSASNHSQDHADNLSNKIEEVAYSSLTFNTQEPKKSTSAPPSPAATETVYTEVQRK